MAAYQRVVRDFPDFESASEAGYAAILGLQQMVGTAPAGEHELWTRLKIDAQIEFAMVFPDDPRAVAALADAANALFALAEYAPAVVTAIAMPLTFSIADGIGLGFICYALMKLAGGKLAECSPAVMVIAALFALKFAFL